MWDWVVQHKTGDFLLMYNTVIIQAVIFGVEVQGHVEVFTIATQNAENFLVQYYLHLQANTILAEILAQGPAWGTSITTWLNLGIHS